MSTSLLTHAPAKINLYLHITGRRADGYHQLDSLAAFAGVGDSLQLESADAFTFALEGPQAALLQNENHTNNLAVRAIHALAALAGRETNFKLTLTKNLPVASGIGGGSSDAAAALRLAAQHWGVELSDPRVIEAAAAQGQDVPLCLTATNTYLTAEGTAPGPALPHADIVLINPNKALPTPQVFKAFRDSNAAFSGPGMLSDVPHNIGELVALMKLRHNDLYKPACGLMPEIENIIAALNRTDNCLLARMSGSGATCFAIYPDRLAARQAAAKIFEAQPGWWVVPTSLTGALPAA